MAAGGLPRFAGQLPGGRLAACLHGRCLGVIDGKYLGQAGRFQDAADLTGRRDGAEPLPGRSSVYRALVRHGLVEAKKRKRRREGYRRWERGRAMELWQMDVMGRVHLAGGQEVKIVTGLDDHSRFIVSAKAVLRAHGPAGVPGPG